jgi:hypothetical protein
MPPSEFTMKFSVRWTTQFGNTNCSEPPPIFAAVGIIDTALKDFYAAAMSPFIALS